jgi:hypothetical protein
MQCSGEFAALNVGDRIIKNHSGMFRAARSVYHAPSGIICDLRGRRNSLAVSDSKVRVSGLNFVCDESDEECSLLAAGDCILKDQMRRIRVLGVNRVIDSDGRATLLIGEEDPGKGKRHRTERRES